MLIYVDPLISVLNREIGLLIVREQPNCNAKHVFFSTFVKPMPNYSDYCNRPTTARAKASAASDMNTKRLVHNNR